VHGWACTALGEARAGLREMERALERWREAGNTIGMHAFLLMLADAYLIERRVDEAGQALADPLLAGRSSTEGWLEPLLRCLRAEHLQLADSPDATAALRAALAFAEERGAKLLADRLRPRLASQP